MTNGRHIPEDVKRLVRQDCRFGCVICGMPLFEYDHIDDFAEVGEHEPANLVLLCPNHHRDKTADRLSRERVREGRRSPFNAGKSETSVYGIASAAQLDIWVGSNQVQGQKNAAEHFVVWINGNPYVTIHREGNAYTYSALVTDDAGRVILRIDHGELAVATDVWDYRYEGRVLSIRSARGQILLEAEVADHILKLSRGTFVDQHETGLLLEPGGAVVPTMSGLHVGSWERCRSIDNAAGAFAVVRRACFPHSPPHGFGFFRDWAAPYEQDAMALQKRMKDGAPDSYPKGLETFRSYPR